MFRGGLKIGYCLMIGGEKEIYEYLEPIFKTLAPKDGYLYCGLFLIRSWPHSGMSLADMRFKKGKNRLIMP